MESWSELDGGSSQVSSFYLVWTQNEPLRRTTGKGPWNHFVLFHLGARPHGSHTRCTGCDFNRPPKKTALQKAVLTVKKSDGKVKFF